MPEPYAGARIGCLCIGDITSGTSDGSGRFLIEDSTGTLAVRPFPADGDGNLWERLREALYELRRFPAGAVLVAKGTGCAAALALAEQLPVERVALLVPALNGRAAGREARRLMRFARQNLSLLACDTLVAAGEDCGDADALRPLSRFAPGRFIRLKWPQGGEGELLNKREKTVNQAISYFLRDGELPKKLAENPEMCIIDG